MKTVANALATTWSITTCAAATAAQRHETGDYTSEERQGLKTYKSQKRFNWMTENNRIIHLIVCMNEPSGSIEYREFRKRTKEHFKNKRNLNNAQLCHATETRYKTQSESY